MSEALPHRDRTGSLFRWVALLVCLVIGLEMFTWLFWFDLDSSSSLLFQVMAGLAGAIGKGSPGRWFAWTSALGLLLFGLSMWHGVRRPPSHTGAQVAWQATQIVLALLLNEQLLILAAAASALCLPRRLAWACLAVQLVLTVLQCLLGWQASRPGLMCSIHGADMPPLWVDPSQADLAAALVFSLLSQVLAFCLGFLGSAERRRRARLAVAHAQLRATQHLLAETARASERARVARELHDSIGHHLMALNLQLELALRRAGGDGAPASVRRAQALTREVLAAVRQVVRNEGPGSGPGPFKQTGGDK